VVESATGGNLGVEREAGMAWRWANAWLYLV
jgi:hypothetical protein